jgi:hypothetical protein
MSSSLLAVKVMGKRDARVRVDACSPLAGSDGIGRLDDPGVTAERTIGGAVFGLCLPPMRRSR